MGAGLVKAAFEVAAEYDLDHAPTRALVFMAVTALDDDDAPAFYAGRDALAHALGKTGPAGHRAVTRALEPLTSKGLIASRPAAPGHPARHLLLDGHGQPLGINEGRSPSLERATEDGERPSNGGRSADQRRTVSVPTRDAHRPAEEERNNKEEGAPPPRFCTKHPNGTTTPCGACADARRAADAWQPPRRPARPHVHMFDPRSGYCGGCGAREDAAA